MKSRDAIGQIVNKSSDQLIKPNNDIKNNEISVLEKEAKIRTKYNSLEKSSLSNFKLMRISRRRFMNKTYKNSPVSLYEKMKITDFTKRATPSETNQIKIDSFSDIKIKNKNRNSFNSYNNNTKKNEDNQTKNEFYNTKSKNAFKFDKSPNTLKEFKSMGKELIKDISTSMNIEKEIITYFKQNYFEIHKKRHKNLVQTVQLSKRGSELNLQPLSNSFNKRRSKDTFFKRFKKHLTVENNDLLEEKPSIILIYNNKLAKKIWDFIILLMAIYSVLISPIHLAFFPRDFLFSIIEIVLEVFMFLDLLLGFFTTYTDIEENTITKITKIIENYLTSWFFIDLLSSIPFDLFIEHLIDFERPLYTNSVYQLKKTIFKWFKMVRIFKVFKEQTSGRFIYRITFMENNALNRIIKFLILFFTLSHICSSFFIYLGFNSINLYNWIDTYVCQGRYIDIYIASLYFNLVTIYSVGYGDIVPVTVLEKMWTIIFMMSGSMLYSYAVSSLSTVFSDTNNKYIIYQNRLSVLESINQEYNLPFVLYCKILKIIDLEYKKNKIERYIFLESLPTKIKNDLIYLMYEKTIVRQKFFKKKPHDFILYVLPLLKFHKVAKNDILISAGNIVEEMYFVMKGTLSLNLGVHFKFYELFQIRETNHFGDLFLQINEISPYELKCKSISAEVLVLSKEGFQKTKSNFSHLIMDNLDESYKSLEQLDRKSELIKYFFNISKEPRRIKVMINKLLTFLFSREFENYFYFDVDFKNPVDFIHIKESSLLKDFMSTLQKENLKYSKSIIPKHFDNNINSFYNLKSEIIDIHNVKPIRFLDAVFKKNAKLIGNKKRVDEIKKNHRNNIRKSFRKTLFQINFNLKNPIPKENNDREKKINKKTLYLLQNKHKTFLNKKDLNRKRPRKSISENMLFQFGDKLNLVNKVNPLQIIRTQNFEISGIKKTSFSEDNLQLSPVKRFSYLKSIFNKSMKIEEDIKKEPLEYQKCSEGISNDNNNNNILTNFNYQEDQNIIKLNKILDIIKLNKNCFNEINY